MNKAQDYTKALQMIDIRIQEFIDVFGPIECEKVTGGPELSRRETLLMHLLDELAILNAYGDRNVD